MTWTDNKISDLVKLWGMGWSQREIARKLGTTENAIAGKVARLRGVGIPMHRRDTTGNPLVETAE